MLATKGKEIREYFFCEEIRETELNNLTKRNIREEREQKGFGSGRGEDGNPGAEICANTRGQGSGGTGGAGGGAKGFLLVEWGD